MDEEKMTKNENCSEPSFSDSRSAGPMDGPTSNVPTSRRTRLCPPETCVGCGACQNACRKLALRMVPGLGGFLFPEIDPTLCSDCGRCAAVCPVDNGISMSESADRPATFACWDRDINRRKASASGGAFAACAADFLRRGGVVFGVGYDDRFRPVFMKAEDADDLTRLQSSKYSQADTGTVFRDVQSALNEKKTILFAGMPCQVAALYSFLGGRPEGLTTCDLICYGVPSTTFFERWLRWLGEREGGSVASINLRSKSEGWPNSIVEWKASSDSMPIRFSWRDRRAAFLQAFMKCLTLRESCFTCPFRKFPRPGDLTLGDFWGLGHETPFPYETMAGVSLVFVNDSAGERLLRQTEEGGGITRVPRSFDEAVRYNPRLIESPACPAKRNDFLRDADTLSFEELITRYEKILWSRPSLLARIRGRIGRLLGKGG